MRSSHSSSRYRALRLSLRTSFRRPGIALTGVRGSNGGIGLIPLGDMVPSLWQGLMLVSDRLVSGLSHNSRRRATIPVAVRKESNSHITLGNPCVSPRALTSKQTLAHKHWNAQAATTVGERPLQMATNPVAPHVLVDLTCPHCKKKNSVAITPMSGASGASDAARAEIKCAYCKQPWEQVLPGAVMAGPFPK